MTRYVLALAVEVDGDAINEEVLAAIADALAKIEQVRTVEALGPIKRNPRRKRTIWADVATLIRP